MPKVSIQIVTWNSLRYTFDCLESLMRQSYRDFSILIIDNASEDGTVEFIRANYPEVSVLQNFKNLGFCKANNQGIQLAKSEYVLAMNPDVILAENFLENLVAFADQNPRSGSFGGKILKLFSEAIDSEDAGGLLKAIRSSIIDSAGLKILKSRQVINIGEGENDSDQYGRSQEVFGISGACVLYRKSALEEVTIKNEYFDQDFFAYKEDIDLAWRLRLYGFTAWYVPSAVCYHHRRFKASKSKSFFAFLRRGQISRYLRLISFRNQHLMLVKNDEVPNIFLALPKFFFRELGFFFYNIFFEPFQWQGVVQFFQYLPKALVKRRVIMKNKKTSAKEIRQWFK